MMKTIQITIDQPLLDRLDCLLEKERTARSAFIRDAIERELHRIDIAQAEEQWRQSYLDQPQGPAELIPVKGWADGERWDP